MRTLLPARLALLACGIAALTLATGCAGKKNKTGTGDNPYADEQLTPGTASEVWEEGDHPMSGDRFDSLARVEDASFAPVYFGLNNFQIDGSEYGKIDAVTDFLRSNPDTVLIVEGHCDDRGTVEYNMSLGDWRAQTIRSYMISSGIDEGRIQTQSYGKERPAVQGSGEAVWSRNRRGEFDLRRR